jgi:FkbM family methyltransferase
MREIATFLGPLARHLGGLFGLEIIRAKTHRGVSLETDLKRLLGTRASVIIDAGANIGTFSEQMLRAFKAAKIFAFEPIPQTFAILKNRMAGFPQVTAIQAALGERSGNAKMRLGEQSGWSRIVTETDGDLVSVEMKTVDDFCDRAGLARIALLKTDCEGYDDKVVRGAERMFRSRGIDAVYYEVNFRRDGSQGDFFGLDELLTRHDFCFYALYDYSAPSPTIFANALWIHHDLIAARQPGHLAAG